MTLISAVLDSPLINRVAVTISHKAYAAAALKGFTRAHLAAGESQRVRFTLTPRDMSLADAAGSRSVMPSEYHMYVGGTKPRADAAVKETNFPIAGGMTLPE